MDCEIKLYVYVINLACWMFVCNLSQEAVFLRTPEKIKSYVLIS